MKIKQINSKKAPVAVGPYSQGIKAGDFLFCSGQIGLDPESGELVKGGIKKETEQVLENLLSVLLVAGTDFQNVVRVDIFLTNINNFRTVNKIYEKYFSTDPKPARQTVEVSALPKGAKIEISCIVLCKLRLK